MPLAAASACQTQLLGIKGCLEAACNAQTLFLSSAHRASAYSCNAQASADRVCIWSGAAVNAVTASQLQDMQQTQNQNGARLPATLLFKKAGMPT